MKSSEHSWGNALYKQFTVFSVYDIAEYNYIAAKLVIFI